MHNIATRAVSTLFENHRKSLIASEKSYFYILSGQKFIQNAKNRQFRLETCGQTLFPDRSFLKGLKLVEKARTEKFKCDIFSNFQTLCIKKVGKDRYPSLIDKFNSSAK